MTDVSASYTQGPELGLPYIAHRHKDALGRIRVIASGYRPHRPHRLQCGCLQGFLAVDTKHCLPTARDRYRPPPQVSPAYRLPGNEPFCRAFSSSLVIALGAVDIFRTSNDDHRLLPLLPQPTILHAQHQQSLTRCFGRLARRSRLLTNHAAHAVASFHPLHRRGTTVVAPFLCRRPPVHFKCSVRLNR